MHTKKTYINKRNPRRYDHVLWDKQNKNQNKRFYLNLNLNLSLKKKAKQKAGGQEADNSVIQSIDQSMIYNSTKNKS